MTSVPLKLTYFDLPGRGELIRLTLSYGQIDFEDDRVDEGTQWPALKSKTLLGQLPLLTVGGNVYCQSMAIARYAARLTGLYPTDALEALEVDMIMESILEARVSWAAIKWRIKDEVVKAEKTKVFVEETIPKIFGFLETQVQGKFFLGDKPSLADLHLLNTVVIDYIPVFGDIGMSNYPKLEEVVQHVQALPTIAAYLAKAKLD